jgi:hypothetical protein
MSGRRCRVPSRFSIPHLIREEVPKPPQCPSGIAAATRLKQQKEIDEQLLKPAVRIQKLKNSLINLGHE